MDYDELLDICSTLECRRRPTKENLNEILVHLSHKETIQKPKFIIDCWHPILKFLMEEQTFAEVYEKRVPTVKNVLTLLKTESAVLDANAEKVFSFLKKFIRESEKKDLEKFLRFCTGADSITSDSIIIHFKNIDGFGRASVAHTCGCILELPTSYDKYTDFRSEMNSLLASNIWIMDIA